MNFKIKNAVLVVATLLSTAVVSAPAFSADPMLSTGGYDREFHKMAMMKMVDANGDHMVTLVEFDDFNSNVFIELDKNKDGTLDATEWVGTKSKQDISLATGGYSRELRTMKMMEMVDANSDHNVSKDEFLAYQRTIFAVMDAKGNKQIDPQEWLAKHVG
jgi:hypothetical protein